MNTLALIELLKVLFENIRTDRPGEVEGVTVSIVDAVDVVGAGNLA